MIIPIVFANGAYDVDINRGNISKISAQADLNRRVLIVTDSGVPAKYAQAVAAQCKEPTVVTLPQGEKSKSIDNFALLLKTMLSHGFTRSDAVVAVGGGVVGDLSGFAASCYMRGVDFINVPTTLLSQVDSSVGGKTAIDFENVKNSVGTFYRPKRVVIDPDVLKTLDRRQFASGLAEVIKMAATFDEKLFTDIENGAAESDIDSVIARAVDIKRRVVEQDEKESGLRRVLNFGHTVGHGIESASDLCHGECVALGMLPMCSPDVRARLIGIYEKYGLPTKTSTKREEIIGFISHDKKRTGDVVSVVTVKKLGSYEIKKIPLNELERIVQNSDIFID